MFRINIFLVLTLLVSITISNQCFGQDLKQIEKDANSAWSMDQYSEALPLYEKLVQAEPNNADFQFKYGVCLENQLQYHKARVALEKAQSLKTEVDKEFHYWYGEVLHHLHDWDKAEAEYKNYIGTLGHKDSRIKTAELHMKQIAVGKELFGKPTNHRVKNLGEFLNGELGEHSPVISMDNTRLIFTQMIKSEEYGFYETKEQIVEAHKNPDGTWSQPKPLGGCLGEDDHNACVQLFDHDKKMLVYKPERGGDLFISKLENGEWGKTIPLEGINSRHHEADATITEDGKIIYFTSDRFSKDGHTDIFKSTLLDNGAWSEPVSMGPKFNSKYDEIAPYITHDQKTFYFCSNGEKSMGEFDVFKSTLQDNGEWSEPVNMGYPINSTENDIYYHIAELTQTGYLASYRVEGYGLLDIYEVREVPETTVDLIVMDANGNPIYEPGFEVTIKSADGAWKNVDITLPVKEGKMSCSVVLENNYTYTVTGMGKKWDEGEIDLSKPDSKVFMRKIQLDWVKPVEVAVINENNENSNTNSTNNTETSTNQTNVAINDQITVYFDYNKHDLNTQADARIKSFLSKLKLLENVNIEVVGHTDNVGSDAFNITLSKKRAEAVKKYLQSNGIKAQITTIGKGENSPIVSNDTSANRAKNRRVEISYKGVSK